MFKINNLEDSNWSFHNVVEEAHLGQYFQDIWKYYCKGVTEIDW